MERDKINTRREAWDFAIGLNKIDRYTPSAEMLEMVEQEIRGDITTEQIVERLCEKYKSNP